MKTVDAPAPDDDAVRGATRRWLQTVVIGLDLCPFAGRALDSGKVHFAVSRARSPDALLADLDAEISRLDAGADIGTTLLIHPEVLGDFLDYNDFLDAADALLEARERVGVYQIASFHPDYRFGGTAPADAENHSNRSPFPMLHLLREDDVEGALAAYPDPEQIPERNIARLRAMGATELAALLQACME